MILQALVEYYERLAEQGAVTRPGWSVAKVSHGLQIGSEGQLLRVVPLKQEEKRGKKSVWNPALIKVPEPVTRTVGISPNFLCDHSGYLLGIDGKGKPERTLQCFQASKERHLQILESCTSEPAKAVKAFFESWEPQKAAEHEALKEDLPDILTGGNLVFIYDGQYVQEDSKVIDAWNGYREQASDGYQAVCLVTGKRDEIARIHTPIKGVPGAQSSGAALVSFNAPAFESYGKEQSYNAPVGVHAVYAYTTALNYLIGSGRGSGENRYRATLGDTVIVYWSKSGDPGYQQLFMNVMDPDAEVDTQDLLNSVFKNLENEKAIDIDEIEGQLSLTEPFYILGIAPNAARLSVRFFYQDSFGNLLQHIGEHYKRMQIIRPSWDNLEYMGIWRMMQETVNKKSKNKTPNPSVSAATYRAILSGGCYPAGLYSAVLGRIRSEQDDRDSRTQKITPGRAAIIKAYLVNNYKEDISVGLNEENNDIAYVLGREFAVLEAIQEAANPGINATIKDRYFNSACATPAMIFPILFRLKNSHIRKISNKGQAVNYEKLLGELQEKITILDTQSVACPKRLTLDQQGMFIMGYYHQTQKRYEKKGDK
ncbi:type I-C CRISPR-associated protein Cas8c/Csd1 [Lacrimispora sp. 210928-DFI.3.58]|uniref:type I-C CRISPR-associated protein Cas8c/Csd1 n=1 Tax=Lacrimispora sp. 210928-DFI.3.58 TaxID=2883214 RepID=UPI0015B5504C|nr:type I-C CRISPR-associated protein Cas8c/Csd1 [Lacrimispora sp. 210928-DFI.3.58]MCB7317461.1 type I-C CRISPR-associated protein Cas8c/Csd1 [Lacrimispora sp. 210928-DFI.3.58]